jgi:hypothetical protein
MYPRNALQAASNPKSHVLRQIEYLYHTGTGGRGRGPQGKIIAAWFIVIKQ